MSYLTGQVDPGRLQVPTAADGGEHVVTDCYACQHNLQELSALPSRERVYDDGRWRVAHAFTSALLGWMVVVPRRHVVSMAQLTAGEATAVGPLLAGLSRGLERNLGARKAYVAFFAEAEGLRISTSTSCRGWPPCPMTAAARGSLATWRNQPTSGSAQTRWIGLPINAGPSWSQRFRR
jgi:hypothetical protein